MFVFENHITADDGRILLSFDENHEDFILNIWDRLYHDSLEVARVPFVKLLEWNDACSPLYDYFLRVGGGVSFLEIDALLENNGFSEFVRR